MLNWIKKNLAAQMSRDNTSYTASDGLVYLANKAKVEHKLHPSLKTGSTLLNFSIQTNNITKLLLGQQLLQNNSIFNRDMVIQAQADCPHLNEIINDLKSANSKPPSMPNMRSCAFFDK